MRAKKGFNNRKKNFKSRIGQMAENDQYHKLTLERLEKILKTLRKELKGG